MSQELAVLFRERLSDAFERSDFKSHRALSQAAGLGDSRVHRIIKGQFDDSKDGPGFFNVVRLCQQLSVTPDYFAGVQKWGSSEADTDESASIFIERFTQQGNRPSTKEVARRYVRGGARVEAFTDLKDYYDLYEPPHEQTIKVIHVGSKSLAGQRIGGSNPALLQACFDQAPDSLKAKIYDAQVKAFAAGYVCEPDYINEMYEPLPMQVKIDYLRSSMRVADADGREFLLLFAELIPQ